MRAQGSAQTEPATYGPRSSLKALSLALKPWLGPGHCAQTTTLPPWRKRSTKKGRPTTGFSALKSVVWRILALFVHNEQTLISIHCLTGDHPTTRLLGQFEGFAAIAFEVVRLIELRKVDFRFIAVDVDFKVIDADLNFLFRDDA